MQRGVHGALGQIERAGAAPPKLLDEGIAVRRPIGQDAEDKEIEVPANFIHLYIDILYVDILWIKRWIDFFLMAVTHPTRLYFTGDDEADRFLAEAPLALLVGFVLDQQVTVQKAFSGPLEIKRRLGTFDAAEIAATDPAELEEAFRTRPAIHRFPGSMAKRVQELCAVVADDYGGRAERLWLEADSGRELQRRLLDLPGIGPMKANALIAILGKRFGVRPPGWEDVAPSYPTLGDVDSAEALEDYQEKKRAHKAALRARKSA
jgi:uncharacterized HhH-GPD family protein